MKEFVVEKLVLIKLALEVTSIIMGKLYKKNSNQVYLTH